MKKYLIILIFLFTNIIFANYADTYGVSAGEISKGNAVTATVNNWSSSYYNVAGLGKTSYLGKHGNTNELSISYMYTIGNLNLNIEKETAATDDLSFGAINLGLVLDLRNFVNLPQFLSSARLGFMLGSMQSGILSKINDLDIRTHSFLRYGRDIQRTVIFTGLGLGFMNDMFGIGIGAHLWSGGDTQIQMRDLELNSENKVSNAQTQMNVEAKAAPTFGFYFNYDNFDLGLSYKHEMYMEMVSRTNAKMLLAGVEMDLEFYLFDFYTPSSLSFGIAYNILNILTLSVDLEYQMWSNFKTSKSVQFLIARYNEDNASNVTEPKMKDTIIPKLGLSYSASKDLKINAGYFYKPSFLPSDSGKTIFNYLDSDAQVISLGINYILPKNDIFVADIELNLTSQMQFLASKTVIKDDQFISEFNPDYAYSGNTISIFAEVLMKW